MDKNCGTCGHGCHLDSSCGKPGKVENTICVCVECRCAGCDERRAPQKPPYDPDDPHMRWVIALAEGFRRAGATHSPIAANPESIHECIETAIQNRKDKVSG